MTLACCVMASMLQGRTAARGRQAGHRLAGRRHWKGKQRTHSRHSHRRRRTGHTCSRRAGCKWAASESARQADATCATPGAEHLWSVKGRASAHPP